VLFGDVDWSFACLIAPVVTTISIFSSTKIQYGDILVPTYWVVLENGCQASVVIIL